MAEIPPYLVDMVRRRPPDGCKVMPGTVPVVSFGDVRTANVATLSINPSSIEFAENGEFLPEAKRRLATLDSLGADDPATLTDAQVASVVDQCFHYFEVNPYRQWFDQLDVLLRDGLGYSYYDGTACHLDLVQWATDPVWSQLDRNQQQMLLDDGARHLEEQLKSEHISLVVVSGKAGWSQLLATGLVEIHSEQEFRFGTNARRSFLHMGSGCGVTFVGWTLNPQRGLLTTDRENLTDWLKSVAVPSTSPTLRDDLLERMTVTSKTEFADVLRRWLTKTTAETIGEVGSYGGSPLLTLRLGDEVIHLNADTKRSAVDRYLATVDALGAEAPWRVTLNLNGTANKVEFAPSGPATPGWYCYLKTPRSTEGSV